MVADPIELGQLGGQLGLGEHEHIALVGGGGKTTLLHALGRQLGGRIILTTTTRMARDQDGGFDVVSLEDDPVAQSAQGPVLVWGQTEGSKVRGVSTDQCDRWFDRVDHVVVEADGSRQLPFKAPAPTEPIVPRSVTRMISVVGADALGRVISDQCHRPLRVAALAGCHPYERLTPAHAATVLLHPRGARQALPPGASLSVVITKVDATNRRLVEELVEELGSREAATQTTSIKASIDASH